MISNDASRIGNVIWAALLAIILGWDLRGIPATAAKGSGMEEGFVFRGFPHKGKILEFSYLDEADRSEAKKYYEGLFLGRHKECVVDICSREQKLVKQDRHDAWSVYCRTEGSDHFHISYRFAMREPKRGEVALSYFWDVDLFFDGDISGASNQAKVIRVKIFSALLAP